MAKKPNGRPKPAREEAASPAVQTIKVIDEGSFKKLVKAVENAEADKNEAVGSIGSLVANAIEKKHLHKKAFSIYRGLKRLSDAHLALTLSHLDHYREIGGLDERASRQMELGLQPGEGEPEDGSEPEGDNVVRFDSQSEREQAGDFEPEAKTG
jgi:hypothetical protein